MTHLLGDELTGSARAGGRFSILGLGSLIEGEEEGKGVLRKMIIGEGKEGGGVYRRYGGGCASPSIHVPVFILSIFTPESVYSCAFLYRST